ncbi:unnamed protein product [Agarophyton chilense]
MSASHTDSSTVAIPWFNNIWLNDASTESSSATPCRHARLTPQSTSSSRHTMSTLSAFDRMSLCSIPSSARQCSAQELPCVKSNSTSHEHLAVSANSDLDSGADLMLHMRFLHITSGGQLRLASHRRPKLRSDRANTTGSIDKRNIATQGFRQTIRDVYRTR